MLSKLNDVQRRFEQLEHDLAQPETLADPAGYASQTREYKHLAPIVAAFREYTRVEAELAGAQEMLADPQAGGELRELAEAEVSDCRAALEHLTRELTLLLLPRDENDDKNVMIEIRAGAGGEEAALFAYVLYRMYNMYAAAQGFRCELVAENPTELGGFREVTFMVSGEGAYSRFKFESGVHRVQRVPETETAGRIHTSTATVAVLPEAEEVEVEINPSDLQVETIKSSGAGGQHVNKTESAIRLLHKPTGIVVECQDERSQFKNRDKAMKLLRAKLYDKKRSEQSDRIASERRAQVGTGDRSERIRTYNYPQSRVTDHRIGLTLHSLEAFLNGDIGAMIDALITADTAEKLKSSGAQSNGN